MIVAFSMVTTVLSVDLSLDEVHFSNVIELRLIFNQPVEVRVGTRVLSTSKVKFSRGV